MYLRLLVFLPATLIPACASSSPAFHMMYSAYKLNKQYTALPYSFPDLEPVCCSMSSSNCPVLCLVLAHLLLSSYLAACYMNTHHICMKFQVNTMKNKVYPLRPQKNKMWFK